MLLDAVNVSRVGVRSHVFGDRSGGGGAYRDHKQETTVMQ